LISLIRENDEEAIRLLMEKYSKLLWKVVDAVLCDVGSVHDIEECVADVFIQLWQDPGKFDPGRAELKSYLCLIAKSKAIDRFRKLTRHINADLDDVTAAAPDDLEEGLILSERSERLNEAISRLDELEREILIRRYYYDQKPSQIALACGLKVKQVENSLYRIKQRLRKDAEIQ